MAPPALPAAGPHPLCTAASLSPWHQHPALTLGPSTLVPGSSFLPLYCPGSSPSLISMAPRSAFRSSPRSQRARTPEPSCRAAWRGAGRAFSE